MAFVSDYRPDPIGNMTILLYGPPGSGKTTLAATAPKPVFILAEHNSVDVLASGLHRGLVPTMPDIYADREGDPILVETTQQLSRALAEVDKMVDDMGWETLVIDSLSSFARSIACDHQKSNPGVKGWGTYETDMLPILTAANRIPINVIWICYAKKPLDISDDGSVRAAERLDGKLRGEPALHGRNVRTAFKHDALLELYLDVRVVGGSPRRVLVGELTPSWEAKDAWGVVGRRLDVTDGLSDLWSRIQKARQEAAEASATPRRKKEAKKNRAGVKRTKKSPARRGR